MRVGLCCAVMSGGLWAPEALAQSCVGAGSVDPDGVHRALPCRLHSQAPGFC